MAAVTATKTIINWMFATSFDDLPADVQELARLSVYDGIGSNLACSLLDVAHRMHDFTNRVGGPPDCTMIGFPQRTSALNAAQLNGMLGHADEVYAIEGDGVGAHVLAANMAAAVTAGQLAHANGKESPAGRGSWLRTDQAHPRRSRRPQRRNRHHRRPGRHPG